MLAVVKLIRAVGAIACTEFMWINVASSSSYLLLVLDWRVRIEDEDEVRGRVWNAAERGRAGQRAAATFADEPPFAAWLPGRFISHNSTGLAT